MAKLIVTSEEQGVREYELSDGDKLSVGRELSSDIFISEARVSRVHASFYCRGLKYFITDLFSRNGTMLNGEFVVGDLELHDKDIVNIGSSVIVLQINREQPTARSRADTATGGFSNTKIAAAQFRSGEIFTEEQVDLLQREVLKRGGLSIHQDSDWILVWWHGGSLTKMAEQTVKSSVDILRNLRKTIPSLNVFIFALSALLEEPTWKLNLMGDPIKICDEFNTLLKAFSGPIIAERAIVKRVSSDWKFNAIANIRFKKNLPACELSVLEELPAEGDF